MRISTRIGAPHVTVRSADPHRRNRSPKRSDYVATTVGPWVHNLSRL